VAGRAACPDITGHGGHPDGEYASPGVCSEGWSYHHLITVRLPITSLGQLKSVWQVGSDRRDMAICG
jgi:hypothetical protein